MIWKKMCATGELVNLGGEKGKKICQFPTLSGVSF